MPSFNRSGMQSYSTDEQVSTQKPAKSGGYDIAGLKEAANSIGAGPRSDEYKYQVAVELARSDLGDEADKDEAKFKQTIDKYYEQLDPSNTGREARGENVLTDAMGAIGGFFDSAANLGGQVIDGAFDATIGNLGSAMGYGDTWKNWFDANDAAMVADTMIDLGLSAIPYAGIPLAAVKNLSQSGDEIEQAITGRDAVTNEDLTEWSRLGNAVTGGLAIAGSVLPGLGNARANALGTEVAGKLAGGADEAAEAAAKTAAKGAAKEAAEGAAKTAAGNVSEEAVGEALKNVAAGSADDAARATLRTQEQAIGRAADAEHLAAIEAARQRAGFGSGARNVASRLLENAPQPLRNAGSAIKGAADKVAEKMPEGARTAAERVSTNIDNVDQAARLLEDNGRNFASTMMRMRGYPGAVAEGLFPYAANGSRIGRYINQKTSKLTEEAAEEAAEKLAKSSVAKRVAAAPGKMAAPILREGANAAALTGSGLAGVMAETGLDPVDAMQLMLFDADLDDPNAISGENFDGRALMLALMGLGTNRMGGRLAGPKGAYSRTPVRVSRYDNLARQMANREQEQLADNDTIDTRGMTQDELYDFLDYARGMYQGGGKNGDQQQADNR